MPNPTLTRLEFPDREAVLARTAIYDLAVPRYTSYPTAPTWSDAFSAGDFTTALGRMSQRQIAVYVHIPYCERLCHYCACNRVITRDHDLAGPFLDTIEREAELIVAALPSSVESVQLSLGGGTPTFLRPAELERLGRILRKHFPKTDPREEDTEWSVEVDPRVTTYDQLGVLAGLGFDRISMGVQDFDPAVQRAIHREQSVAQTSEVAEAARGLGFRSVNFDLIYGLPFQTRESFGQTLHRVIDLRPDRIALYSYAHVPWHSRSQRGFERSDLPSAETKLEIFLDAVESFRRAGYDSIGFDHFARPEDALASAFREGRLQRNFMGYTTKPDLPLIALGPSGISELGSVYAQSAREPKAWQERISRGELATIRGTALSEDDERRRFVVKELLCCGRICPERYAARYAETLAERVPDLAAKLERFVADGLLAYEESGRHHLTELGWVFARVVATVFDAHLAPGPGTESEGPRFSRAI